MAVNDQRGAQWDHITVAGADFSATVTAVDTNGDPVDLSAATITPTVYDLTGTAIATLTATVSGAGSNVITLSLTDTEVDALTSPATWSLVVSRGSDDRTWLAGEFVRTTPDDPRPGTTGETVTATVDTNVVVTATVLTAVGGAGSTTLAGLTDVTITAPSSGEALTYDGAEWTNTALPGGGDLLAANNLSDLAGPLSTARTNLGLGTAAVAATGDFDPAGSAAAAQAASDPVGSAAAAQAASQPVDADLTTIAAANNGAVLAATTASFTTADETKLDGIEAAADVTDATNVAAAGAVMETDVDAKGDLFVATAADTLTRLPIGTDGQVLTADSAEASGLKYATPSGGGGDAVPVGATVRFNAWDNPNASSVAFTTSVTSSYIGAACYSSGSTRWIEWAVYLTAGTYTIEYWFAKFTDAGIIDTSIDGTVVQTVDHYATSLIPLSKAKTTGIVVGSSGKKLIRFAVNGKNASSSSYFLRLHGTCTIERTA